MLIPGSGPTTDVNVTDAEVRAIRTAPDELAPGAGVSIVVRVSFELTQRGSQFPAVCGRVGENSVCIAVRTEGRSLFRVLDSDEAD